LQTPDKLGETPDVGDDELLLEARFTKLALDVARRTRAAALEPTVQVDVREDPAPEDIAQRHEASELLRSDPIDAPP
jgi:hypothetical protein